MTYIYDRTNSRAIGPAPAAPRKIRTSTMKITTPPVAAGERAARLSVAATIPALDMTILIARGRALQAEAVGDAIRGALGRLKRLIDRVFHRLA